MSEETVYGVDISKPITPIMVRDALTQCFIAAHTESLEIDGQTDVSESMITLNIQDAFAKTGGDYENPTKESLLDAMMHLKEFSKKFRSPEIIANHFQAMQELVNKCE